MEKELWRVMLSLPVECPGTHTSKHNTLARTGHGGPTKLQGSQEVLIAHVSGRQPKTFVELITITWHHYPKGLSSLPIGS